MAMKSRALSTAPQHGGRPRSAAIVLGTVIGWHAAAAAGYVIWALTLPAHNSDGVCEGLGWGCTPPPRDGAFLLGVFVGVPLVMISTVIAMAMGTWLVLRRRTTPVWAGTAATLVAVPATVVGAFVLYGANVF
ncbi:hypothetical protein [Actinophytocola sp.]|uniref:hypothetical protein n=1 Tax=Actinophytocola sp. TaxID=1872138 RepID=UPI002D7F1F42|nr:hypothetical protein [Actinophytocola sp.]HET9138868.1 hypothetical protein [Actinophytocola sp.]